MFLPTGRGLAAGEELGPDEESRARPKAVLDERCGEETEVHRRTLLRHDRGREQPSAGQWARVYQGPVGVSMPISSHPSEQRETGRERADRSV
jgi:hypothetical protein